MSRLSALAGAVLLGLVHPAAADGAGDGRLVVAQAGYEVQELQRALNELGYNAGPVDGALGPTTRNAIRTFQADQGLPITGEFSYDLLRRAREAVAGTGGAGAAEAAGPSYSTQLVANIQAELRRRGYDLPVVTGQVDAATEQAIRAYQRDRGLAVTGEPSEQLLAGLREAGGEAAGGADRELVREIQERLRARGYDVGVADGVIGPSTRDAIRTYQADAGLPITGEPSQSLLRSLRPGEGPAPRRAATPAAEGRAQGGDRLRDVDPDEVRVVLRDGFADGDYTSDPPWTVHSGAFAVQDGALVSRVAAAAAPGAGAAGQGQGGGPAGPEEFGLALLQGVLEQVVGAPGGGAPQQRRAEISTAAPIGNAFHLRLDVSSHADDGRFAFGPYQGADRGSGYRLAYASGERPSLELLGVSPRGVRVVATSDRMIDLEDGEVHTIRWHRGPRGRMVVTVDGEEVLSATDRGFEGPFEGFTLTNAGGVYAVHQVAGGVPE